MQDQVEMLGSAEDSNDWFLRAQRLNAERRTQLGTFNHLPPEIRIQIWRYVARDNSGYLYSNPASLSAIVDSHYDHFHRNGNVVYMSEPDSHGNDLHHLQKALGRHAFDFEHVYLSMVTLAFNGPDCFRNFLSHVQNDSTTRFCVDIHLFNYSGYRRQLTTRARSEWREIGHSRTVRIWSN